MVLESVFLSMWLTGICVSPEEQPEEQSGIELPEPSENEQPEEDRADPLAGEPSEYESEFIVG
jgi:hypothetical protein